jgi:hypothetical protein
MALSIAEGGSSYGTWRGINVLRLTSMLFYFETKTRETQEVTIWTFCEGMRLISYRFNKYSTPLRL